MVKAFEKFIDFIGSVIIRQEGETIEVYIVRMMVLIIVVLLIFMLALVLIIDFKI